MSGFASKRQMAWAKFSDPWLGIAEWKEPEQEPEPQGDPTLTAWRRENDLLFQLRRLREEVKNCHLIIKNLQKKREFVGLTDDDIFAAVRHLYGTAESAFMGLSQDIATARAIEANLKEKNFD